MRYPTKEQVLKTLVKESDPVIKTVMNWKQEFYTQEARGSNERKNRALLKLIRMVGEAEGSTPQVVFGDYAPHYDRSERTVYLNEDRPSIITTLHELAHHLFGRSEIQACRWSVQIFKICFPKAYEALTWEGHKLVRRS